MKNILFHMSVIFLLFVMVVMNTGETASARSIMAQLSRQKFDVFIMN